MKTKRNHVHLLVQAALFAALIYVSTRFMQIPIAASGGYIHPGDCLCLLAAWFLPMPYGIAASAIGTMLADLLSGYAVYALPSFIIKAVVAAVAGFLLRRLWNKKVTVKHTILPCLVSGLAGEFFMVTGYFLFSAIFRGNGLAAAVSIPTDSMQAAFGIVAATALFSPLARILWRRHE